MLLHAHFTPTRTGRRPRPAKEEEEAHDDSGRSSSASESSSEDGSIVMDDATRYVLARLPSIHRRVLRGDAALGHVLSETLDTLLREDPSARPPVAFAHQIFRQLHRGATAMEMAQRVARQKEEAEAAAKAAAEAAAAGPEAAAAASAVVAAAEAEAMELFALIEVSEEEGPTAAGSVGSDGEGSFVSDEDGGAETGGGTGAGGGPPG